MHGNAYYIHYNKLTFFWYLKALVVFNFETADCGSS